MLCPQVAYVLEKRRQASWALHTNALDKALPVISSRSKVMIHVACGNVSHLSVAMTILFEAVSKRLLPPMTGVKCQMRKAHAAQQKSLVNVDRAPHGTDRKTQPDLNDSSKIRSRLASLHDSQGL